MKSSSAVAALSALAQGSRLAVYRHLVRSGPQGDHPGRVAARLRLAPATLSFHLKELVHAGLVTARPEGRRIRYAPDFRTMNALLGYLTEHCCAESSCEPGCTPAHQGVAA